MEKMFNGFENNPENEQKERNIDFKEVMTIANTDQEIIATINHDKGMEEKYVGKIVWEDGFIFRERNKADGGFIITENALKNGDIKLYHQE